MKPILGVRFFQTQDNNNNYNSYNQNNCNDDNDDGRMDRERWFRRADQRRLI